ncbi:MAG: hypothetical protein ACLFSQ_05290 [Candidatus Zixiibacteriota bacterium]
MRRNLSILALLLLAIAFLFIAACEGPEGPQGPAGEEGEDGTDGANVPTISTITANPPVTTVGDTIQILLDVTYSGDSTLYYNWNAGSGSLSGSGVDVNWITPDAPGSYVVTVTVTAGSHTSQGAVSILVRESESDPVYTYAGMVTDEDGMDISPVLVYQNSENFVESSAGGMYEINSMDMPISLTFYKEAYEALTISGFTMAPDIELKVKEPEIGNYYSVMIKASAGMWYPDGPIRWSVGSTNGTTSHFIEDSLGPDESFMGYYLLDSIPEGEWQLYAKGHDLEYSYMGITTPMMIDHDITDTTDAIEIELTTMKNMQCRTLLDFPEMPIDKFIVEAFIDSTIQAEAPPVPRGRAVLNWDHWHDRSVRDSIYLTGGFLLDNYESVEIFFYHVTARVWGRQPGIYATKTIRDIPWGSYWLSIDMRGAIPTIDAELNESGEIQFNIDGSGDIYCVELFHEYQDTLGFPDGYDYVRFWRGITENRTITLPALPPSYEVYPWNGEDIYYQVSSFVDPDFSIDDYDLEAEVERELSRKNALIFPDTTDGLMRRRHGPPGQKLELF